MKTAVKIKKFKVQIHQINTMIQNNKTTKKE